MFILKTKDNARQFYKGMIGGIILEITQDKQEAMQFETKKLAEEKIEELRFNFELEEVA